MTRPDDEFPPLDVTSTLNLGALDEVLEGPDTDVVPSRMSGSLPPGMALLVVRRGPNAGARFLLDHDVTTSGRHLHRARRRLAQRYVREPRAGRGGDPEQRGRGADRQVPPGVHRRPPAGGRGLSVNQSGAAARDPGPRPAAGREAALMSIGEVLAHLRTEFPDTTISKL